MNIHDLTYFTNEQCQYTSRNFNYETYYNTKSDENMKNN